jgi:hypothetical protein
MADPAPRAGMTAVYRFKGETVHTFESFPSASEASNEYESVALEERENHSFLGKLDGGVPMPALKSSGPFAQLVTAIKVRTGDSVVIRSDVGTHAHYVGLV